MNTNLREALLEVVTKGLPPEDAALLLLEPSRWDKDLFGPTGDLQTIYKSYLRGEVGIGRVFDAASDIASAASSLSELADSVSRHYGDDAKPDDIPEEVNEEDRIPAEDTTVEVLQIKGRKVSVAILDSIRARFPTSLLEQVFPAPSGAPTDVPRLMQSFESGQVVDRAFRAAEQILVEILPQIRNAWSAADWGTVAAFYQQLQEEAGGLVGDIMVMNQVANAVVGAGMGDSIIPSQRGRGLVRREQLEAWMPAALGRVFEDFVEQLHAMLTDANTEELSYADLKRVTDNAIREGSPIMSFVDTDAERDIEVISGRAQPAAPAAAEVAPEPTVAAEPAPTVEPAAELPQPPQPEQAVAGMFGPEEPEDGQQSREVFSRVFGIDYARAGKVVELLTTHQISPADLADKLEQVLSALVTLGYFKSWQTYQRKYPNRARSVQRFLRQGVSSAIGAGRDVVPGDLLRGAIQTMRGGLGTRQQVGQKRAEQPAMA